MSTSTTNSPETLQLVASELEATLTKHVGQNTFYVLILAEDLDSQHLCNCITNIPPEREPQLRNVLGTLSKRHAQMHN